MFALNKYVVKLFGQFFMLLVLGFTGFQTYSLLYSVSKDPLMSLIGLVLFEGGMLYWWSEFRSDAEGIGQMAVSLLLAVFGLLLVAGATALHLGALDKEFLGPHTPARLITIAAIINLCGKFVFPLLDPETFKHIWTRALEGAVVAKAYLKAQSKTDDMSAKLADKIATEITRMAEVRALTSFGLLHRNSNQADVDAIDAEYEMRDTTTTGDNTAVSSGTRRAVGDRFRNWWNAMISAAHDEETQTAAAEPEPATVLDREELQQALEFYRELAKQQREARVPAPSPNGQPEGND
jgi:hypothetical protein